MKKEIVKNLLEDLYTIYNPDHLIYIDQLVDKYHQMPTEAIGMVLIRYNHPNFDHYDEDKATPEYVEKLIQDYAVGNRTLQGLDIVSDSVNKKQKEENNKRIQEEESQKAISEKEEANRKEIQKEKDKLLKELEEVKKIKEEISKFKEEEPKVVEVEKSWENDLDVSIHLNYKEEEVILPNSKFLSKLGIGARIVTTTKSGKVVGLSIKDIVFDNTTVDIIGKPSVMIFIDKE
jgi:hypothetical protein|tara:strand:- start:18403 stop:19101 length:699 start_codon:yes stop_codon:yes gene_type:complete